MATRSEVRADLSAADTWTDPMSAQRGSYQILITGTGTAELTLRWTPSAVSSTAPGGWSPVDPSDSATAWYTRARPTGKFEPGTYTDVPQPETSPVYVQVGIAAGESVTGTVTVRVSQ